MEDAPENPSPDGQQEEHPKFYISNKTKRGPLKENWIKELWNNGEPKHPIMCAYKLCRVEFKYWGMQNKIEKYIHETGKRS